MGSREEPIDITSSPTSSPSHEPHLAVTPLDGNDDTFEMLLLALLRAHSRNQLGYTGEGGGESPSGIAPEALNTLSFEQLHRLMTSTSMNFNVVQQILSQKEGQGHPISNISDGKAVGGETKGQVSDSATSTPTTTLDLSKLVQTPLPSGGISIQLTPEQLTQLRLQVSELLLKTASIPGNLPVKQQQAMVQALIAKQLNLQQPQPATGDGLASPTPKVSCVYMTTIKLLYNIHCILKFFSSTQGFSKW